jgi:hypothetical protein
MRIVVVRYTVTAGREPENEALVRDVYAELSGSRPAGFSYATFREEDASAFMHLAAVAEGQPNPLPASAAFARFQAGIGERCEQPPIVTELTEVGSYALWDR